MTNDDVFYDKLMTHNEADRRLYSEVMTQVSRLLEVRSGIMVGASITDTYIALADIGDTLEAILFKHSEATKGDGSNGA